jgi:hypothetical protein
MVGNRPVDIALLHHLPASRVLCWHNILRGGFDERPGAEALEKQPTGAAPPGGRHHWAFSFECII